MKIEKTKINGYDVYIHKTDKYSTIHVRFLFELPYTKENICKYDLLEEYQIHSCAKYKTRKELNERRMELYTMGYGLSNYNIGEKMFVDASFSFYDPELVGEDYLKSALELARDVLLYPNFENGKLDREELERCRTVLATDFEDNLLSFKGRTRAKFLKTFFPNTYKTVDIIDSIEEYNSIMRGFSDADLIAAHEELFQHNLVGVVIMGNIKEEYLDYIGEMFAFKNTKELDDDYKEMIELDTKEHKFEHFVDEDYVESMVEAVYPYEATTEKERLIHYCIMRMIGGSGMLVHKVLRDEQGIVYSAGASYNKKLNYLILTAYIDAKNVEIALEGFEMVFARLKEGDTIEKLLAKIKEEVDLAEYIFDESKWNVFYELYDTAFNFELPEKERNDIIRSITVDDIVSHLDKLNERAVFFYEGGKK